MKLSHILAALYGTPLLITEAGFETIDAIVRPHLAGKDFNPPANFQSGKTDIFGNPLPEMLEVGEDGIAVINIYGPLLQHASLLDKSCGACSYQDIVESLAECADARDVEKVFLNIDSPGGQHCGMIECAERVARFALEKEIYAFGDSLIASAAYGLAAGCTGIFGTKSGSYGSIGSIIAFLDRSKAYEEMGLKPVVLASGKFKGTGYPGTSLTPEQNDYLMALVIGAADQFKTHVLHHREISAEHMEGQIIDGEDAQAAGLLDEIVADLAEAKAAVG